MKYLFLKFLILLIISLSSFSIYSQSKHFDKKVTLIKKNTSLKEIIITLEQESNLLFSYNNAEINESQKITIIARKQSIKSILDQLASISNFNYILIEKQVIIKPKKTKYIPDNIKHEDTEKNKLTISGYLKDAETDEPLIGATIIIEGTTNGTITNNYGFYSISLPKGNHKLIFSYIGYKRELFEINLNKNIQYSPKLKMITTQLNIVAVKPMEYKNSIKSKLRNSIKLSTNELMTVKGFSGSSDFMLNLTSVTGINQQTEGSAFYHVRGGAKDQNLIIIDEAPVFHPSHLFGIISAIAPDAINSLQIYKSDFPIEYGGRIGSITDIRTKNGNMNTFVWSSELNPFTGNHRIEFPILKNKISFSTSLRNSHINWILKNNNENANENHFYDLHAKLNFKFGRKNKWYIALFSGGDYYSETQFNTNNAIAWDNNTISIRWNHLFSDKMFANFTIYLGTYNYYLYTNTEKKSYWYSNIANYSFRADFTRYFSTKNTVRFGIEWNNQEYSPANLIIDNINISKDLYNPGTVSELVPYIGNELQLFNNLALKCGVRMHLWNNYGNATLYQYNNNTFQWDTLIYDNTKYNNYLNFEPRLSLIWNIFPRLDLKIDAEQNVQYIHTLSNSISPFTTLDLWIPSGINIKPTISKSLSGKLSYFNDEFFIFIEGFYKKHTNQIDYINHANILLNPYIESQFKQGTLKAFGFETSLQKKKGNLTFQINYSYSKSIRNITDINNNNTYLSDYDQPHHVNLLLNYSFNQGISLHADFIYHTGILYTAPTGFYTINNQQIPYYQSRNNKRLPDYHRLDLSAKYGFNKNKNSKLKQYLVLSIYNVYNRSNFISVFYNKIITKDGSYVVPSNFIEDNQLHFTGLSMPGILPLLTYRICFNCQN